jgi:hypothetical protein
MRPFQNIKLSYHGCTNVKVWILKRLGKENGKMDERRRRAKKREMERREETECI